MPGSGRKSSYETEVYLMLGIIGAAGGGVGMVVVSLLVLVTAPWFITAVLCIITAFNKDQTRHKRLRRLLRELRPGLTTGYQKK